MTKKIFVLLFITRKNYKSYLNIQLFLSLLPKTNICGKIQLIIKYINGCCT